MDTSTRGRQDTALPVTMDATRLPQAHFVAGSETVCSRVRFQRAHGFERHTEREVIAGSQDNAIEREMAFSTSQDHCQLAAQDRSDDGSATTVEATEDGAPDMLVEISQRQNRTLRLVASHIGNS